MLTQPATNQAGSVWNVNKINLNNLFDFTFNVYLGCLDANGADGIVFILQPISTSIGSSGEGMGFGGISPSVGISLDTWQNTNLNDPVYDHISIQLNGIIVHGSDLAGPTQISATSDNVEDCAWHTFRIKWDPVTKLIKTYFDGQFRLQAQKNLVTDVFNNDPLVYWGFSGATGGAYNLQQFCTALNPNFNTNFSGNTACVGNTIQFTDSSQSFAPIANYYWNFGDSTTSSQQNPQHSYAQPGTYNVKLVITALDGCISDTLVKTVTIIAPPAAAFNIYDTCYKKAPRVILLSDTEATFYQWQLNGNTISSNSPPPLNNLTAGTYSLTLIISSVYNCPPPDTLTKQFIITPGPGVEILLNNGCVNKDVQLTGIQTDNQTIIDQWHWNFGNGQSSTLQNPIHQFNASGQYPVQLWAISNNRCVSDTVSKIISISKATAFAGNDTVVVQNIPFQLNGTGGGFYSWSPATGLNNSSIANPVATLQNSITYLLTVTSPEGCVDTNSINITIFKGSSIYVPTAFTPNNDGLNDVLKPYFIGIKKLDYFTIYNRWGQKVFTTTDMNKGWDGAYSASSPADTFVWVLEAEDVLGKVYKLKGVVLIIK